jgi:hypothetical protein
MPMREDCRHFESRSYEGGETARFCRLDLAPEAPWKCPDQCPRYEPSLIDGTFVTGSLERPAVEDEPDESPDDIEAVLDDAEAIVTNAEPDIVREVEQSRPRSWWKRRRRRGGSDDPGSDDPDGFGRLSNR